MLCFEMGTHAVPFFWMQRVFNDFEGILDLPKHPVFGVNTTIQGEVGFIQKLTSFKNSLSYIFSENR